jgi:hypothetical protein
MSHIIRRFLFLAAFGAAAFSASAQIGVALEIKRHYYVRHEPLLATVTITNLSGRDLLLEDGDAPWFGFQISQGDAHNLVPPRQADYKLDPLEIKLGETLKRQVNLTELYRMSEYGPYRIQAVIYGKAMGKFFPSKPASIDITEGQVLWQQSVGVPDTLPNAGATHRVQLLAVDSTEHRYLYCRIEDQDTGTVYCTHRLGHLIDGAQPQMQFDTTNTLNILQITSPKTYLLSQIGVNGEVIGQSNYVAMKFKPTLRRDAAGGVSLTGATRVDTATASTASATTGQKLSDRPPGLH